MNKARFLGNYIIGRSVKGLTEFHKGVSLSSLEVDACGRLLTLLKSFVFFRVCKGDNVFLTFLTLLICALNQKKAKQSTILSGN